MAKQKTTATEDKPRGYWSGQMRPIYEAYEQKHKEPPTATDMLPLMVKAYPDETFWKGESKEEKKKQQSKLNSFIQSQKPEGEKKKRGGKGKGKGKGSKPSDNGNTIVIKAIGDRVAAMSSEEFIEFAKAFNEG